MLTYFPMPYPGEWWYSVLCRYFVRSGHQKQATVLHELYGSQVRTHGRLFPGGDIFCILERLPEEFLDLRKILLGHTLAPYYLRFYSPVKKSSVLNALLQGKSAGLTNIEVKTPGGKTGLKFCPKCFREDLGIYGEAYWHREHQIPLIPLCPKHGCRLILYEVLFSRLSEKFLPLCALTATDAEPSTCEWEKALSNIIFSFLTLPFEAGPTSGYSNLELALQAKGFYNPTIQKSNSLNVSKVYEACDRLFGDAIAAQYFSTPSSAVLYRACHWKLTSPERYALLTALAGLTAEELFGPELDAKSPLLEKLLAYQKRGLTYRKEELAQLVGVSPHQLDTLSRKYGVSPFWKQCGASRSKNIRITLSPGEKDLIQQAAAISGNGQTAVFARTVLLQEARRIANQKEGSGDS